MFTVRVCAVIRRGDEVLLNLDTQLPEPHWVLPGGRARFGEPTRDGAVREIREEVGVEPQLERLLWVVDLFFGTAHSLELFWLVSLDADSAPMRSTAPFLSPEDDRFVLEWHRLDTLPRLLPVFLPDALRALPDEPTYVVCVE